MCPNLPHFTRMFGGKIGGGFFIFGAAGFFAAGGLLDTLDEPKNGMSPG